MKSKAFLAGVVFVAATANAQMRLTEFVGVGNSEQFVEFTNVGATSVDMTGWSFDDVTAVPGTVDLSAFGIVTPGEAVVWSWEPASTFISEWSMIGVDVIGNGTGVWLGRDGQLNLYDDNDNLVDRLTYGPFGTGFNGLWVSFAGLGQDDISEWTVSLVGDMQGSYTSLSGYIGSPGTHVIPEPTSLAILTFGSLAFLRRAKH